MASNKLLVSVRFAVVRRARGHRLLFALERGVRIGCGLLRICRDVGLVVLCYTFSFAVGIGRGGRGVVGGMGGGDGESGGGDGRV